MNNAPLKAKKEPLIHITKRASVSTTRAILVRVIAVAVALAFTGIFVSLLAKKSAIEVFISMFNGVFKTKRKIMRLLQGIAILLSISLAITPAFKMKFWNCGAEGQVLMGGLATAACMFYFGGKLSTGALVLVMFLASVLAGAIWAVIPAIFKAFWGTNETLFTLMLNYVAIQMVCFCINIWVPSGSATLLPMWDYGLPKLFGKSYWLNVVIVAIITAIMYIYLKYTKHGYEISVVGESENTAKYVGINVKKVIIRTVAISGAVCGITGLLLVGGTDYTISENTAGGQGFTAIMVSWLAKFNPLYMILTTFLVVFLKNGTSQVADDFRNLFIIFVCFIFIVEF